MQLLFVAVLIIGLALCVPMNCDESDDKLWDKFKAKYSKKYTTSEEESRRKIIFLKKVQYIRENNKRYKNGQVSYALATNQLSDLTNQEVSDTRFGFKPSLANLSTPTAFYSKAAVSNVPDEIDWRNKGAVTPIKDQGTCGSCWAFSAVGSLESLHFIKTGKLVSLSEQNLIDCSKNDFGCKGGLPSNAFDYIKQNGGIDTEESYPYTRENLKNCKYNPKNVGASDKGYVQIPIGDEQKLKEAVATIGPIAVAMYANRPSFLDYAKGVIMDPACKSDMDSLDHAVVVVGYGTTDNGEDFWLVKNSWGKQWGINGYAMMARNKNSQCGIATYATYPIL